MGEGTSATTTGEGLLLDPFLVAKKPIFKAFWDFRRTKMGHHKLAEFASMSHTSLHYALLVGANVVEAE